MEQFHESVMSINRAISALGHKNARLLIEMDPGPFVILRQQVLTHVLTMGVAETGKPSEHRGLWFTYMGITFVGRKT